MADNNQFNNQFNQKGTPNNLSNTPNNFDPNSTAPYNPSYSEFNPQQSFDTGLNNNLNNQNIPNNLSNQQAYSPYTGESNDFNNQANDYNYAPANPEIEEFEEEIVEKPKSNTKKIIIFGLIALMVILLVSSIAIYIMGQTNKPPTSAPTVPTNRNTALTTSKTASSTISIKSDIKSVVSKTTNKTGPDANSPAGKSIVNAGAKELPKKWIEDNFKSVAGAVGTDGKCKISNICSENADPDNDGFSNLDEFMYATSPNSNDTDGDGLGDGDEIKVYSTNPKSKDSDSDTYPDASEIINCYDPNLPAKGKMDTYRLNEITSKANSNPLKETATLTLQKSGATTDDLEKGYINKNCTTIPTAATTTESSALSSTETISGTGEDLSK
jgi:hypothetical protein